MTTVLPNGDIQSNPKIAYNKGYEKGRADAEAEHNKMCETCVHKVSQSDIDAVYQQGKADAIEEVVGNTIESIEEIKKWYEETYKRLNDVQICIVLEDLDKLADELKGWQKGAENE